MPEIEVPIPIESPMSDYCRFTEAIFSMPPMKGFDANFDLGVEQVDSNSPDRP